MWSYRKMSGRGRAKTFLIPPIPGNPV